MLDINDTGRRCVICSIRTAGVPLCRTHYKVWWPYHKEPWFQSLLNAVQREERKAAQAQARVVSLDELEDRYLAYEERTVE